ncbi:MAG: UDP-glucose dehydrogenase family protein [Chloroflexota bacterium]
MQNIAVVGVGYVGLVTGASLANLGNQVICVDYDAGKIAGLRQGVIPIFEPGLEEMVQRNARAGRLRFTTSYEEALAEADLAFIAVGTPSGAAGQADLRYVEEAARSIALSLRRPLVIVNKSTVPIGTGDLVADIVRLHASAEVPFAVVSNPEFLREGSAVYEFAHPDRIVLGSADRKAAEVVAELYKPLERPVLITDLHTAEMIKYASNAFLATKISFINEIANICEELGADVKQVAAGMGLDRRIGPAFLDAGLGWGGSCFPKDVRALISMAANLGAHPQLLRSVVEINEHQRRLVIARLLRALGTLRGRTVGLLGLAFKPNTDDIREAPAIEIAALLRSEGARVQAYDPVAVENARRQLPDLVYCADPYELARGCDALVVVTEWDEFRGLDMAKIRQAMRGAVLVDGRNIFDPEQMRALGFEYFGVGRGQAAPKYLPLAAGQGLTLDT